MVMATNTLMWCCAIGVYAVTVVLYGAIAVGIPVDRDAHYDSFVERLGVNDAHTVPEAYWGVAVIDTDRSPLAWYIHAEGPLYRIMLDDGTRVTVFEHSHHDDHRYEYPIIPYLISWTARDRVGDYTIARFDDGTEIISETHWCGGFPARWRTGKNLARWIYRFIDSRAVSLLEPPDAN